MYNLWRPPYYGGYSYAAPARAYTNAERPPTLGGRRRSARASPRPARRGTAATPARIQSGPAGGGDARGAALGRPLGRLQPGLRPRRRLTGRPGEDAGPPIHPPRIARSACDPPPPGPPVTRRARAPSAGAGSRPTPTARRPALPRGRDGRDHRHEDADDARARGQRALRDPRRARPSTCSRTTCSPRSACRRPCTGSCGTRGKTTATGTSTAASTSPAASPASPSASSSSTRTRRRPSPRRPSRSGRRLQGDVRGAESVQRALRASRRAVRPPPAPPTMTFPRRCSAPASPTRPRTTPTSASSALQLKRQAFRVTYRSVPDVTFSPGEGVFTHEPASGRARGGLGAP